ncbi:MAG: DUF2905 domain-containing protein [Candidatus Omnitrophica bacterium]|nr:DUF2905 domain-containing protein [Candidatus Omnitrophota bacterium]
MFEVSSIGKILIGSGIFLVLMGLVFITAGKIPWVGKLPGDIIIQKENFSFYFPLTTCIILSAILSLAFFLTGRR